DQLSVFSGVGHPVGAGHRWRETAVVPSRQALVKGGRVNEGVGGQGAGRIREHGEAPGGHRIRAAHSEVPKGKLGHDKDLMSFSRLWNRALNSGFSGSLGEKRVMDHAGYS